MGWQDAPAVSGQGWKSAPAFEEANRNQSAREVLEALEAKGELRPAEQQALEVLRGSEEADTQAIGETGAAYRGFTHDLMAGQRDTLSGVGSFLSGEGYAAGRDASRAKDRAAYEANPEAFTKGQMAGSGSLAGVTLGVSAPFLQGANWLTKALAGSVSGAGMGFNQAVQEEQIKGEAPESLSDYDEVARRNWKPILAGGAIGGGAHPVAATVGATARGVGRMMQKPIPGMGRKASSMLRQAADTASESGQDIRRYLSDLTDEAMLADVPEFRATGQGLAAQGGAGGKALARAITERQQGNSGRITADMTRHIDEPDAAFNQLRANAAERTSTWGPEYDAALASPQPVGTDRIAHILAERGQDAVGAPSAAMRRVARELGVDPSLTGPQAPITAARAHNIRSNLGDDLSAAAQAGRGKFSVQVGPLLGELDASLDQVPGYAQARTGYANNRAMDDAVQFGADALDGGRKTAVSPAEFADQFNTLSGPEKDAVRKGLRSQVARIMGTSRNDAAAAWGEFAKDWNEQKLRLVLGDEAADPLIKRLRSEQVFSQTHGAVNAGSQTDFRTAAREALEPVKDQTTGQQLGPVKRLKNVVFDAPLNAAADSIIYGPRASQANLEMGKALGSSGAARDAIVQALIKQGGTSSGKTPEAISKIVEILLRGGGAAASSALVTNN